MIFVGVDPGKAGGIAALHEDGRVFETHKMPETSRDVLDLMRYFTNQKDSVVAMIERVNAGVFGHKQGRMGVVSAFTFGRGYERLQMALLAAAIPFEEVAPNKWQAALQCQTKGDKNISKAKAQKLFPKVKVTHANADALLIAEYARRTWPR